MPLTKGTEVNFVGPFKTLLTEFVQLKCSLGYNYTFTACALERFSRFTVEVGVEEANLTKDLALSWVKKHDGEKDVTWEKRINNLRQFALYLVSLGYPAYIPSCKAKIDRLQFEPHIYTEKELQSFFYECDNLPATVRTNNYLILPVLFRLLYGSGLRISEALNLKLCDIDFNEGIITIKGGKNDKDRLLPLSKTLQKCMHDLYLCIHKTSNSDKYFFMKLDKTKYHHATIYKRFRYLLWKSGISHGGKAYGPRIHDFRHTFAVNSLRNMIKQEIDTYTGYSGESCHHFRI